MEKTNIFLWRKKCLGEKSAWEPGSQVPAYYAGLPTNLAEPLQLQTDYESKEPRCDHHHLQQEDVYQHPDDFIDHHLQNRVHQLVLAQKTSGHVSQSR